MNSYNYNCTRKVDAIYDTGSGRVLQSHYFFTPDVTIQDALASFSSEHAHAIGGVHRLVVLGMVPTHEMHNCDSFLIPLHTDDHVMDVLEQDYALVFGPASALLVLVRLAELHYKVLLATSILASLLWCPWLLLVHVVMYTSRYVYTPMVQWSRTAYGDTITDFVSGSMLIGLVVVVLVLNMQFSPTSTALELTSSSSSSSSLWSNATPSEFGEEYELGAPTFH